MKISKFEELTQFVSDEYTKMTETYNVQRPSEKFMHFIEETLVKYAKLYDKPLYKLQKKEVKNMYFLEKQELEIEKAINTMPHGRIWKFFHGELWKKMTYRVEELKQQEEKEKSKKQEKRKTNSNSSVPAVVIKPVSSPVPPEDVEIT